MPAAHVTEVMRRLPIEVLPGAPDFMMGVSIVRGAPAPVVDLAQLLGERSSRPGYFISAREGDRKFVLAVDEVLGVRPLPAEPPEPFPSILESAAADFVSSMSVART